MKESLARCFMAAMAVLLGGCGAAGAAETMAGPIRQEQTAPQQQAATEQPATPQPQVSPKQQAAAEKLGLPVVITDSIGMKLVLIPAGEFLMGSLAGEEGRHFGEGPQHSVRITLPFYLSAFEVTGGQFRQFVEATNYRTEAEQDGEGGSGWTGNKWDGRKPEFSWRNIGIPQSDEFPVVNVSWNDAVAFCQWLSTKERRTYRLPTEAEWEYSCRAGSTTRYSFGNDEDALGDYAWCDENSSGTTHRVGEKRPNAWGLYDMHGNVWEWCGDWWADDYHTNTPVDDPTGPTTGSLRVGRGGSWYYSVSLCRAASRRGSAPVDRDRNLGFRVAAVPSASK